MRTLCVVFSVFLACLMLAPEIVAAETAPPATLTTSVDLGELAKRQQKEREELEAKQKAERAILTARVEQWAKSERKEINGLFSQAAQLRGRATTLETEANSRAKRLMSMVDLWKKQPIPVEIPEEVVTGLPASEKPAPASKESGPAPAPEVVEPAPSAASSAGTGTIRVRVQIVDSATNRVIGHQEMDVVVAVTAASSSPASRGPVVPPPLRDPPAK